jgi:geranylgeranyl pyrophosphate synthase
MDDDAMRRGRPTSHVVFGEGIAILAGDGLLTEAFRLMAAHPDDPRLAERKLRTIAVVGEAAGGSGMVGGQVLDLEAVGRLPGISAPVSITPGDDGMSGTARHTRDAAPALRMGPEELRAMHAKKTGALIRAAAVAGAIMAGGDTVVIGAVDSYAAEVGLAFQIVDDVLDVEGDAAKIGKTAGKDAAAGKPTYPALYGLAESRRLAHDCIERARARLTAAGLGGHLDALADWVVSRSN